MRGQRLRRLPQETLSTITAVAGIFVLVDGVMAVITSIFGSGDGRGLLTLSGVFCAIAGLILIKKPFETLVVFSLIVGVWFVVAGFERLVSPFDSREARGGNIFVALLDLVAGAVILAWPDLGLATLAAIVGVALIVRHAPFIVAGWQLRALDRAVETDSGAPAVA